jgi:hypothetical protein
MKLPQDCKQRLLEACHQFVDDRIKNAQQAMANAQDAANSEEKSSAGDKYETGRAMAQIQRNQAAEQLAGALQLKEVLNRINNEQQDSFLGRLLITSKGNYFLSISAGKLAIDGIEFYAISLQSPLAKALMQAKSGQVITFQSQPYIIQEIQ